MSWRRRIADIDFFGEILIGKSNLNEIIKNAGGTIYLSNEHALWEIHIYYGISLGAA